MLVNANVGNQESGRREPIPQRTSGKVLRVFLVEDLLSTRTLIQDLFAAMGGIALTACATSEGEAKLWLDEHPRAWDVAVVDLVLEAGSGLGVIARCRKSHPEGAVFVFSGYMSPVLKEHCIELGAHAVFHKDQAEELVAMLRAAAVAFGRSVPQAPRQS